MDPAKKVIRFIFMWLPAGIATFALVVAAVIALDDGVIEPWQFVLGFLLAPILLGKLIDLVILAPSRVRRTRQKAYAKKVRAQTDMSN
jgi:hypothetical protein